MSMKMLLGPYVPILSNIDSRISALSSPVSLEASGPSASLVNPLLASLSSVQVRFFLKSFLFLLMDLR